MHVCLAYESALNCWRRIRECGRAHLELFLNENCVPYSKGMVPSISASEAREVAKRFSLSLPLRIEAPHGYRRSGTELCAFRCVPQAMDLKCRYAVDEELYLPEPELVYLQMGEYLTTVELIELGYELTSSFTIDSLEGKISPSSSLLNLNRLAEMIDAVGTRGSRRARAAIKYILPGAESPAEIGLALKLLLPTRWGGFGFCGATLNPTVQLSRHAAALAGKERCRPDLLFEAIKYDVEYDGVEWHSSAEQRVNDLRRWQALRADGYIVRNITAQELNDIAAMTELAREIAVLQGRRLRIQSELFRDKQRDLFRSLQGSYKSVAGVAREGVCSVRQ